jgi:hypothetical protein
MVGLRVQAGGGGREGGVQAEAHGLVRASVRARCAKFRWWNLEMVGQTDRRTGGRMDGHGSGSHEEEDSTDPNPHPTLPAPLTRQRACGREDGAPSSSRQRLDSRDRTVVRHLALPQTDRYRYLVHRYGFGRIFIIPSQPRAAHPPRNNNEEEVAGRTAAAAAHQRKPQRQPKS